MVIKWDDGLSLGIEEIDNDHKHLLDLINKLSDAIEGGVSVDVCRDVFTQLQRYVEEHFEREEKFLKQCHYQDFEIHHAQHVHFKQKLSKLRNEFECDKSNFQADKVLTWLTNWLVSHIIDEDMKFVNTLYKCGDGMYPKTKKGIVQSLIDKSAASFSITQRIYIVALIPFVAMLIFGAILLYNDVQKYNEITTVGKITETIYNINDFTHALQIERGLSSGYLSSKGEKFYKQLLEQRHNVDKEYLKLVNKFLVHKMQKTEMIVPHIERLKQQYDVLKGIRKEIDNKTIDKQKQLAFYTQMINNILQIPHDIMVLNNDAHITNMISALSALLNMKEILGLQRAYGTILIEQQKHSEKYYREFIELLGAYDVNHELFKNASTQYYTKFQTDLLNLSEGKEIEYYKDKIIKGDFAGLDSHAWFTLNTLYINKMKLFVENYLDAMTTTMHASTQKVLVSLRYWFFFTTLMLLIVIVLVLLFVSSSKKQIHELVHAMRLLAKGNKSLRFFGIEKKNDIHEIFSAYEIARRELLKGDVLVQLHKRQQKKRLAEEKMQKERLEKIAYLDPLTGALNRRKFEQVATQEMTRSKRYNRELSFLILDIDLFKQINDTYGHGAGDEVLKRFTQTLKSVAREMDVVARIGGEEFVIMVPETSIDGAQRFAERIRHAVEALTVHVDGVDISFTVSIGVTLYRPHEDTLLSDLLQRADDALYRAKESGRNRVVVS